jgi:hypothetical protein
MSDHLPMWVQLKVDFTEAYLESLKAGAATAASCAWRCCSQRNTKPTSGIRMSV